MELTLSLLTQCEDLARAAGGLILSFYQQRGEVILKADASPLTAADTASHEFLTARLPALLPGVPVVSEESAGAADSALPDDAPFWLVDPLDGTKEFVKGTNEFTVNIALVCAGRVELGVVYAPALGLGYSALRGGGAFRRQGDEPRTPIHTRAMNLARPAVVASRDHAGPLVATLLARLPGAELASMGSSLKFCLVAEGRADLYLRDLPTMEWDTAAAQGVVEAAGGGLFDLSGATLRYGKPGRRNGSIMTVGDLSFPWRNYVN